MYGNWSGCPEVPVTTERAARTVGRLRVPSGGHPKSKDGQSSSHKLWSFLGVILTPLSPTKPFLKFFIMQSKTVGLEELSPMLTNVIYLAGFWRKPNILDVSSRSQWTEEWPIISPSLCILPWVGDTSTNKGGYCLKRGDHSGAHLAPSLRGT